MLSLYNLAVASTLALSAAAATIRIDVGKEALKFTPNMTTAAVGDVLEFHFYPLNHSIVTGRFDRACVPAENNQGFYSGFVPVPQGTKGNSTFSVTINDTNPLVFYCSQNTGDHCKKSMYAVVNPAGQNTLQNYGALAANVSRAQSPSNPTQAFGGVFSQGSPTTTGGNGGTTPAPTGPGGSTPSPTTSTRTGGAALAQGSVGGFLGAVLVAFMMV